MGLVQLSTRRGRIARVPQDNEPIVELQLGEHERVIWVALEVEFGRYSTRYDDRTTYDWVWVAHIETRL